MVNDEELFIRLYIDEDVHGDLGLALRQHDYDVLTVNEAERGGLSDAQQLAFAAEQNRTIFIFNTTDFIALHLEYLTQERTHRNYYFQANFNERSSTSLVISTRSRQC